MKHTKSKMSWHHNNGMWWFRLFGYGLYWKNGNKHYVFFSERNGLKGFRIKHWYFGILKPENKLIIKLDSSGGFIGE